MMRHLRQAAFATPVLLTLAMPPSPARRLQSGTGLTMTVTITSTSTDAPKPSVFMSSKMQINSAGLARSDVLPTGDASPPAAPTGDRAPLMVPGTYSLGKKGNDTTFLIDPRQKKYWVILRPKGLHGGMTYTSFDVTAQRIQPDSTIEGIPVQHWRVTDNSVSKYVNAKSTYDVFVAPGFDIGLARDYNPGSAAVTGDPNYDAKRSAAWAQAMPGLPLLMRTQTQMLVSQGKSQSFSMVMRATNIKRGDPPASVFAFPSGYTLVHTTNP
jgi:hypothetical protein